MIPFRYEDDTHTYVELATGEILRHTTGIMMKAGLVDDRWFTEESSTRGKIVHKLTADYDLGALDLNEKGAGGAYRGYCLAHVYAMDQFKPEVLEVEIPKVHPRYRYGCRTDRVWRLTMQYPGALAVNEIKTGQEDAEAHGVQTALQAMVQEQTYHLPARAWKRYVTYLRPNGRAFVREMADPADFDRALEALRKAA